jgi:hypothetical protein
LLFDNVAQRDDLRRRKQPGRRAGIIVAQLEDAFVDRVPNRVPISADMTRLNLSQPHPT